MGNLLRIYFANLTNLGFFKTEMLFIIVFMSTLMSRVQNYRFSIGLEHLGIDSNTALLSSYFTMMLITYNGLVFVSSNLNTISIKYPDKKNPRIDDVLINALPIKRKDIFTSKIIFNTILGTFLCIITYIPFFLNLGTSIELEVVKTIFFINSIMILGGILLSVGSFFRKNFVVKGYTLFAMVNFLIIYFEKLSNGLWIIYPSIMLITTVIICLFALKRIDEIDIVTNEKSVKVKDDSRSDLNPMKLYSIELTGTLRIPVFISMFTTLGVIFLGWSIYFSIIPFLMLLLFMSMKEGGAIFCPNLVIIKSLPVDIKKIACNITRATIIKLSISMAIITLNIALSFYLGNLEEVDVFRLITLFLTIKFPIVIIGVYLVLPPTIYKRVLEPRYEMNVIGFIVVISGLILALFLLTFHWMVTLITSALLYYLAIKTVKKATKDIQNFLESSVDIY
ncbi:hypothetical protein HYG86_12735 [Alkalicella caledoniensis]|uniref:Uncharacterized protein n=1 Tax=Alkalicella caledoniensis TaxID=2731377 RepID=A0A7G9WA62_ALKCA|nr:hypothetical protein [Alkalicella caledoniensis]QNO15574.1 hypothetical protein HYG86_12735 [Alkalicella caledoniensis]